MRYNDLYTCRAHVMASLTCEYCWSLVLSFCTELKIKLLTHTLVDGEQVSLLFPQSKSTVSQPSCLVIMNALDGCSVLR